MVFMHEDGNLEIDGNALSRVFRDEAIKEMVWMGESFAWNPRDRVGFVISCLS